MATLASSAAQEQPMTDRSPMSTARSIPHPIVLAVISAVLSWLSFPPFEWSWAIWVAMAPLFLLVKSARSPITLYFASWVGGFTFWLLAIHWIWWTDQTAWLGWLAMALFLSAWWPGFLFLARFARRRLALPLMVSAPLFWVGLEYIRAYVLTGFPWYYLAHGQYRQIYLTQVADITGALGLSLLICLVNAYLVELVTTPLFKAGPGASRWSRMPIPQKLRLVIVLSSLLGTVAYGVFRVETARFRPGPRIAMLQTGEVQEHNSDTTKSSEVLRGNLELLVDRASKRKPRPDLIVWPETSYPYSFVVIDPKLNLKDLDAQVKTIDPEFTAQDWIQLRDQVVRYFRFWVDEIKIPMMVGASTRDFRPSGYFRYNSAVLFRPGLLPQLYHKMHLVPFGEYVPLLDNLPWLIRLTPYRNAARKWLDFGERPAWFDLGSTKLAAAICFEDTLPQVVRPFFSEVTDNHQPDILINLSNDGWFHETSEHEMHLAVSTFRCVENRVPMARAVNTGVSAMIDGNGRIINSMDKTKTGVLVESTPLDDRTSLYSLWGDWLGQGCLASTIGLLILGTFRPKKPLLT